MLPLYTHSSIDLAYPTQGIWLITLRFILIPKLSLSFSSFPRAAFTKNKKKTYIK